MESKGACARIRRSDPPPPPGTPACGVGVSLKLAIQHSVSSNSYWQMSRTPLIQQAVSNVWLKEQGLLSVKTKFQRRLTCTQVMPELKTCGAGHRG